MKWILGQLGASDTLVDRLAGGDPGPVFSELRKQALGGDPSAVNILGWIAGQRCRGQRKETIDSYLQDQLTQAMEIPANDAAWFSSLARLEAEYDKKLADACTQLDPKQIADWVTRQAANGDPASQFLMSRDMGVELGMGDGGITMFAPPDATVSNLWLRKAADAGFMQAKYDLAWDILNRKPRVTPASYSAMSLLREAADGLPLAEANLAACEYYGCEGTTPDAAAALIHAHEAAIRGQAEALVRIGPSLGAVKADEVAAWKLIYSSLQQRGCSVSSVSVQWMKRTAEDISTASTVPGALKLAAEIWEGHGRQMMSALGCAI